MIDEVYGTEDAPMGDLALRIFDQFYSNMAVQDTQTESSSTKKIACSLIDFLYQAIFEVNERGCRLESCKIECTATSKHYDSDSCDF